MPKLIVIIGLPGSGKTHYLEALKASGEIFKLYDDFQARSINQDKDPHMSRHYKKALSNLQSGKSIAIADIRYCIAAELDKVLLAFKDAVPELSIDLRYFDNDPVKASRNVLARNGSTQLQLEKIKELSPQYKIPQTAKTLKIYEP